MKCKWIADNVYLYKEGVLRTGAVPFNLEDLGGEVASAARI